MAGACSRVGGSECSSTGMGSFEVGHHYLSVIMVSVCLPSDALSQHLPSHLGFSYLGCGVSLHGCSSKAQPLLLTLDKGYLLTAAIPDLQCEIAPLGLPAPAQPLLPGCSSRPPALVSGVGGSSQLPPLALGSGWLLRSTPLVSGARWLLPAAPDLGHRVSPPGRRP